jgi:predicted enzyme related to lactoylglutathione lyase
MGILELAEPAIVICARDRDRATAFYRDTLGLAFFRQDRFNAVFKLGAATVRIAGVPDYMPHEHTILGFRVADVPTTLSALREKGVEFQRYAHVPQDELGVCMLPGGNASVAWFKDSEGNVLSLTDA